MNIYFYRSLLTVAVLYLFSAACNSQAKDPNASRIQEANDKGEQSVGQFNPEFQTAPKNTHLAVRVNFDNGVLQPAPFYSVRPGSIPYPKKQSGDFAIEVMDAAGRVIGKYYTMNPMTVRVCDGEPNPQGVKTIAKGSFELLLPNDKSIAGVSFNSNGKSTGRLNIPLSQMREVQEGDRAIDTVPGDNGQDSTRGGRRRKR